MHALPRNQKKLVLDTRAPFSHTNSGGNSGAVHCSQPCVSELLGSSLHCRAALALRVVGGQHSSPGTFLQCQVTPWPSSRISCSRMQGAAVIDFLLDGTTSVDSVGLHWSFGSEIRTSIVRDTNIPMHQMRVSARIRTRLAREGQSMREYSATGQEYEPIHPSLNKVAGLEPRSTTDASLAHNHTAYDWTRIPGGVL